MQVTRRAPRCVREGCTQGVYHKRLCRKHYDEQWRRDHGQGPRETLDGTVCVVEGCGLRGYHRTDIGILCRRHDDRYRRTGGVELIGHGARQGRVCSLDDCDKVHYSQGYCQPHYRTWRRYGTATPTDAQRSAHDLRKQRGGQTDHRKLTEAEKAENRAERARKQAERTHCVRGHEFTPKNTYWSPKGKKHCRTCQAAWNGRTELIAGSVRNGDKTHCAHGHPFNVSGYIKKGGARGCRVCHRQHRIQRVYGVTPERWDEMVCEQLGVCAVCHRDVEGDLVVDHDHETGAVRGLLCNNCNNGLGRFRDDPALLQAALDYLGRSRYELALTPSDGDN